MTRKNFLLCIFNGVNEQTAFELFNENSLHAYFNEYNNRLSVAVQTCDCKITIFTVVGSNNKNYQMNKIINASRKNIYITIF